MKREKRKSDRQRTTRYAAEKPALVVPEELLSVNTVPAETPAQEKLNAAVVAFNRSQYAKSYSERHPELSKMFNCTGCGHHHNGAKCELQYSVGRWDPDKKVLIAPKTRKGVLGAAMFARRRFLPHRNQKTLLTIHIAKEMFLAAEKNLGKQPDPSRTIRDAIRLVRGRRQSYNPYRRREVVAGLTSFLSPEELPKWKPEVAA